MTQSSTRTDPAFATAVDVEGSAANFLNPDRLFLLRHLGLDGMVTRAHGGTLFDGADRPYLDFISQYGAVPFGHNNEALAQAMADHLRSGRPALTQPMLNATSAELARRLIELAPGAMRYVTFANSGAETVEAAIKLARGRTRRPIILSCHSGFHGKTLGALSATDNPAYSKPFLVDTRGFDRVPYNDPEALERRLSRGDVAAFIVEPIQGEGGMRVAAEGYLRSAGDICRRHGALLVLDEVQTGLGRTGYMFASDREDDVRPDMILLAKALGGGLIPLGAMLCTRDAWTEDFGFFHSSTFANNGLACAVGLKVLDLLQADDRAVLGHVRAMGERLETGLEDLVQALPSAFDQHSGRGLMHGLRLKPWSGDASYFLAHASFKGYASSLLAGFLFHDHSIVTAPVFSQSGTIRLEPSLLVNLDEIDRVLRALSDAGELIENEDYATLLSYLPKDPAARSGCRSPSRRTPGAVKATQAKTSFPRVGERRLGAFAFLIHPTDDDALLDSLPRACREGEDEPRAAWQRWMTSWCSRMYDPAPVYHLPALRPASGGYVEGWLIAAPLTPHEMMRLRKPEKAALLSAYLGAAADLDVDIVGLGAFTSVISRGGEDLVRRDLNITTGNSLTAIGSAESLRAVADRRGIDLARAPVAIVGSAGSIGRLATLHLSRACGDITLIGNPNSARAMTELREVAGDAYRIAARAAIDGERRGVAGRLVPILGSDRLNRLLETAADEPIAVFEEVESRFALARLAPPVRVTVDLVEGLAPAMAVLSASGAGSSFIQPDYLRRGSVVCDVARPLDVLANVRSRRPDVFVYEGGVMRLPEDVSFGDQNVLGYPAGYNLACLSETISLCMAGARRSYSLGKKIDYAEALEIYARSLTQGFRPAVLPERQTSRCDLSAPSPVKIHSSSMREALSAFK